MLNPVEDTYLDRTQPDKNFGREPALLIGNGKVILLRFPHLAWTNTHGKKVAKARIILTSSRPNTIGSFSISRLTTKWYEGTGRTIRFDRPDPTNIPWGEATWNHSLTGRGGQKWDSGGANGIADRVTIGNATTKVEGDSYIIEGIEEAVQYQINVPHENFGFKIESAAEGSFFSGEFTEQRPRLEIEWEQIPLNGPDIAIASLEPDLPTGDWPKDGAAITWKCAIKNIGTAAAPITNLTWRLPDGSTAASTITEPIEPGQAKVVSQVIPWKNDHTDHRKLWVTVDARSAQDIQTANNSLTVPMNALAVAIEADSSVHEQLKPLMEGGEPMLFFQNLISEFNGKVLPFSRSIRYPAGSTETLRLVMNPEMADIRVQLTAETAATRTDILRAIGRALTPLTQASVIPLVPGQIDPLQPLPIGWIPDTRDDGLRISGLELPPFGWTPRREEQAPLWDNGLLSRIEVAFLENNLANRGQNRKINWNAIESGLLVTALDPAGNALEGATVTAHKVVNGKPDQNPMATDRVMRSGVCYLMPDAKSGSRNGKFFDNIAPDASNAWLVIRATVAGESQDVWVPAWQLLDWHVRGNNSSPALELRFRLSNEAIDRNQDFAKDKVVVDSAGRFPAELAALTDNDPTTTIELFPGQWLEIDITRDRVIASVEFDFIGEPLNQFEVLVYNTSQDHTRARRWLKEEFGARITRIYGKSSSNGSTISFPAKSTTARYIRLVNQGESAVKIGTMRVFGIIPRIGG